MSLTGRAARRPWVRPWRSMWRNSAGAQVAGVGDEAPYRAGRQVGRERDGDPLDAVGAFGVADPDDHAAVAGVGVADDGEVLDVEADQFRGAQRAGPAEPDEELIAPHRRAARATIGRAATMARISPSRSGAAWSTPRPASSRRAPCRAVVTSGSRVTAAPVARRWQYPMAAIRRVIVEYALVSRTRSLTYSPTT